MLPKSDEVDSHEYRRADSKFLENHEDLIEMLNAEQKTDIEELVIKNKRIPISAVTLVIITANKGKIKKTLDFKWNKLTIDNL